MGMPARSWRRLALSTEHKIAGCVAAWYILSLATLWTNRYVVAELKVDSNVLSLAQLGMSVLCGLASEVSLVGWGACKSSARKLLRDGLKDMVVLGAVRILTVLLGLTALKYIAVSFTQTIKSSAPFFTVILTYFLLGQRTGWRVNVSLLPIVTGLVCCSLSDTSFHFIGFTAALLSNCVDCIQNVLTKKLLNRSYTVSQLQLYTSVIAVAMQLAFILYNWAAFPAYHGTRPWHGDRSQLYVLALLVGDGLGFYFQSAFAYMLMSLVSPVTHSVANCVKRALLIMLSIFHFGDIVTPLNWSGMVLVIFGVYFFTMASRLEREVIGDSSGGKSSKSVESAGSVGAPSGGDAIQRSTIVTLSEIRIDKSGKFG